LFESKMTDEKKNGLLRISPRAADFAFRMRIYYCNIRKSHMTVSIHYMLPNAICFSQCRACPAHSYVFMYRGLTEGDNLVGLCWCPTDICSSHS
jgi:hypothetical protein